MPSQFTSIIRKANRSGTGFFSLPKARIDFLNLGDWVRVKLSKDIIFFAKIVFYSHLVGIYIPRRIMMKNELINKEFEIQIEKVDGFSARTYQDGRVYIPKDIVKNQQLKHNDIVLIKCIENSKVTYEKFSKIHVSKRKNRPAETHCVFNKAFRVRKPLFKIEKQSRETDMGRLKPLMIQLLKGIHYVFINKDSIIIFKHKVPAIITSNIKYSDIAFYLGAYFADGTKKGNSWAICASTFEQAKYYLKMHNLLIKDSKPEFTISYTNIYSIDNPQLKRELTKIWKNEVGIKVDKFRIRKPSGRSISKWNKYGTLIVREHRQILLDVYNALLKLLIKEILQQKNKKIAIDFICGVMEGDGCASATQRGHVMIFTNKDDRNTLQNIFKIAQVKFKTTQEEKNKYMLRIGALEILRNFYLLSDKIFILYPKRRIALFERLRTVGAVKFLIGNHESASWIKTWLKDNAFCDKLYKITPKGIKLGQALVSSYGRNFIK